MINAKSIQNVLRIAAEAPKEPAAQPVPVEMSYVIYFYYAPEDKAIDFKNIERDLKNPAKSKALVEKLQSLSGDGVTKFSAGYFSWKKVIVATNKYDNAKKKFIVYQANVDNTGTIVPGSEKIFPESEYPTPDQVKEEFNIFKNGVLNLQTGVPGQYEVYYFNGEPQEDIAKRLLTNPRLATQGEQYNAFSKKVDQFRIWTTNGLVRPDFRKSNTDGVKGGYYPGGEDAFKSMILPLVPKETAEPQKPAEPSLAEKTQEKATETNPRFEPVSKKTQPMKGDYLDTPAGDVKMAADSQIRKKAKNVVMAYLKGAAYSVTSPATMPQNTTTPGTSAPLAFPLGNTVQKSEQNKKKMEEAIKMQKEQERLVRQTQMPQTQMGKLS